ncbi:MAG: type II toxin-antitoxin system HicB family antitoxin [Dehalococcoidia bacterium]
MSTITRKSLDEYLALQYPFHAIAEPEGGYTILFPDLPGCMTQAETADEIAEMAEDARATWIESEYEMGREIPLPSYPGEYSGKFIVRVSRSLHRTLVQSAEREGVSLNQYAATLLARGDAQAMVERRLEQFSSKLDAIQAGLRFHLGGMSMRAKQTAAYQVAIDGALAA